MPSSRAQATAEVLMTSPIFPPSFDNSPVLFGIALFARLLIAALGAATIVRIISRTRADRLPSCSPGYHQRVMVCCLLTAAVLGSSSDCLTWLFWGEVGSRSMAHVLLISKVMDAMTMVPFLAALFAPQWIGWLRKRGRLLDNGPLPFGLADSRMSWGHVSVPLSLVVWTAIGAAGVALGKWLSWAVVTHVS